MLKRAAGGQPLFIWVWILCSFFYTKGAKVSQRAQNQSTVRTQSPVPLQTKNLCVSSLRGLGALVFKKSSLFDKHKDTKDTKQAPAKEKIHQIRNQGGLYNLPIRGSPSSSATSFSNYISRIRCAASRPLVRAASTVPMAGPSYRYSPAKYSVSSIGWRNNSRAFGLSTLS